MRWRLLLSVATWLTSCAIAYNYNVIENLYSTPSRYLIIGALWLAYMMLIVITKEYITSAEPWQ